MRDQNKERAIELNKTIPVIILAGGLGTRLQGVLPNTQKVIASVGGRPFLEIVLGKLAKAGFVNIILATGYNSEQVESVVNKNLFPSLNIVISREKHPMGTAGAVKLAIEKIDEQQIMVLNGDTFFLCDYSKFINFHHTKESECTLLLRREKDGSRYGSVKLEDDNRIKDFSEKTFLGECLINAGAYIIDRKIISMIPSCRFFSLERDLFPLLVLNCKNLFGTVQNGVFIDIGTPQSFIKANNIIEKFI